MDGQFTGWPEQAMDVLWQLQGEPSHATRERCRADRERLVRQPMIALLNEVADADPRYEDFSVWHYRSDSWWWQHQSAVIRLGRKIEIGLRFSLSGLRIQGAWWYPDPGQVDMFRRAVASEGSGRELSALVEDVRKKGYDISGDMMKRPPRGYPADHPGRTCCATVLWLPPDSSDARSGCTPPRRSTGSSRPPLTWTRC